MTPEKKAKSFHTTMVLTQPKMLGIADSKVLSSFPYHYGSYATLMAMVYFLELYSVSIPLWFLRNRRR